MRAIGVDLGGHNIAAALVEDGHILNRLSEPTSGREPNIVVDQIASLMDKLGADLNLPVGVGIPGVLDRTRENTLLLPNFTGWDGIPFRRMLEAALRRPVKLENDANCYALGEGWGGAARGMTDYALLTLGTGIGGGIVIGGKILIGSHGMAAEPGHIVTGTTEPCGCTSHGHMEAIGGADALEREAKGMGLDPDLKKLWPRRMEKRVAPLWDKWIDNLAKGIATIIQLLDPQAVILGGGLSRGEGLINALRPVTLDYLAPPYRSTLDLRTSALGGDAPVIGAASLAAISKD
ncbi:MAG: ROK family protein [Synergistaceae bacterium]|nr:ROK family protein [Synergistota bacterium]NLM71421.1 ROK family protein [Synergistaceae bacterium]